MISRASIEHLRAFGLRYFVRFAIWQLKEDYKTQAYRCYTADMLRFCAVSLGAQVDKRYSDIIADVERPPRAAHDTTLEEAEAAWQKALADSQRAAQERMGGEEGEAI